MAKKLVYVGVDVDDKAFHAALLFADSGELKELACRPDAGTLIKRLRSLGQGYEIKICYEACHVGFTLYRAFTEARLHCDVISSNDIPRTSGPQVKTDRIDALKLAQYYASGLLTKVFVPTGEQESDRDLLRTRRFLQDQTSSLKRYILSMCRRANLNYRKDENQSETSHYWSSRHRQWITGAIGKIEQKSWRINLSALLISLRQLEEQIEFYNQEIEKLAKQNRYDKAVRSLNCYRGINTLSAMTILTELSTVQRFEHPRKIVSYIGMDISEYSSGGKERKRGITKMGNRYLRTALIESCQYAGSRVQISKPLAKRRMQAPNSRSIEVADRCMKRLYLRSHHLRHRGKNSNKVKVACAREMIGFVWESLRELKF